MDMKLKMLNLSRHSFQDNEFAVSIMKFIILMPNTIMRIQR